MLAVVVAEVVLLLLHTLVSVFACERVRGPDVRVKRFSLGWLGQRLIHLRRSLASATSSLNEFVGGASLHMLPGMFILY